MLMHAAGGRQVLLQKVKGHSTVFGSNQADEQAVAAAKGGGSSHGNYSNYPQASSRVPRLVRRAAACTVQLTVTLLVLSVIRRVMDAFCGRALGGPGVAGRDMAGRGGAEGAVADPSLLPADRCDTLPFEQRWVVWGCTVRAT